jgi:hypothetical protein
MIKVLPFLRMPGAREHRVDGILLMLIDAGTRAIFADVDAAFWKLAVHFIRPRGKAAPVVAIPAVIFIDLDHVGLKIHGIVVSLVRSADGQALCIVFLTASVIRPQITV